MLAEITHFHRSLQIPTDGLQKRGTKIGFRLPAVCPLRCLAGHGSACTHVGCLKCFCRRGNLAHCPLCFSITFVLSQQLRHLCFTDGPRAHRRGCLCDSVTEATVPGLKSQPHQSLNTVQGNILNLVHRKRELPKSAPASRQTPPSVCA